MVSRKLQAVKIKKHIFSWVTSKFSFVADFKKEDVSSCSLVLPLTKKISFCPFNILEMYLPREINLPPDLDLSH